MRKTKFSIETFGNAIFEGITLDEDWNGWACPYFTFEEAQKIVEAHCATGKNARYEEDKDWFCFSFNDEDEIYAAMEVNGLNLYPIGAFGWIWEEAA